MIIFYFNNNKVKFSSIIILLFIILLSNVTETLAGIGTVSGPVVQIDVVEITQQGNKNNPIIKVAQDIDDINFDKVDLLDNSISPNKDGNQGFLIEFIYNCTSKNDLTFSPTNAYKERAMKIALISNSACTLETLLIAKQDKERRINGAIIMADALYSDEPKIPPDTFAFPIVYLSDPNDVSKIKNYLESQDRDVNKTTINNDNIHSEQNQTISYRVRAILVPKTSLFPGIWEFTLIVVVVLLAISFLTSVAMHCHLFRLRRRQRRQEANSVPFSHEMKMTTLNSDILNTFPIRLYKNSSKLTTNDDKSAGIIQQTTLGDGSDDVNGIENKRKSNDEKIENPSDEMLDIAINKEQQPESMDAKEIKEPIESTESLNPTAIKDSTTMITKEPIKNESNNNDNIATTTGNSTITDSNYLEKHIEKCKEKCRDIVRQDSIRSIISIGSIRSTKSTKSTKSIRSIKAISLATELAEGSGIHGLAVINETQVSSYSPTLCAICLEDFDDGDELRFLPCKHEYHAECIDPWLIEKSSLCPLCKFDCAPDYTKHSNQYQQQNHESDADSSMLDDNFLVAAMLAWGPVALIRGIWTRWRRNRRRRRVVDNFGDITNRSSDSGVDSSASNNNNNASSLSSSSLTGDDSRVEIINVPPPTPTSLH